MTEADHSPDNNPPSLVQTGLENPDGLRLVQIRKLNLLKLIGNNAERQPTSKRKKRQTILCEYDADLNSNKSMMLDDGP